MGGRGCTFNTSFQLTASSKLSKESVGLLPSGEGTFGGGAGGRKEMVSEDCSAELGCLLFTSEGEGECGR